MADRWFVTPVATETEADGSTTSLPKYSGQADGFSGGIIDFSGSAYSSLPWHPNPMYLVRFYGSDAALDAIEAEADAWTMGEVGLTESDVADFLNDTFGRSYTFDEWMGRFNVG